LSFDLKRWIFLIVALAGIGDSSYQAWEYLTQNFNSCSIQNTIWSCGGVAAWANLHPISLGVLSIPYWATGVVWFPLSLIVGVLAFRYFAEVILIPFLMIGNIFTVYLWYLELDVIHLICPVCLSLYLINYALTGISIWIVAT
jgi:uncharacterized membrane protein